jgi:hypothetical protein
MRRRKHVPIPILAITLTCVLLNSPRPAAASTGGQSFTFVVSNSILRTVAAADGGTSFPSAMHNALCSPRVEPKATRLKRVSAGIQYKVTLTSSQVTTIQKALRRQGCSTNIASGYKNAVRVTYTLAIQIESTTTTTIDPTTAYVAAFNVMTTAVNAGIAQQNSGDPATSAGGINAEVAAYKAFDAALANLRLPGSARTDAQKLLNVDAALEQVLGTLALNTGNVDNYNQIFNTVTPAETAVTSAQTALNNDLGVTSG